MAHSVNFLPIYTTKIIGFITVFLLLISTPFLLSAQKYILNSQSSKLIVEGTSTLHDWEIESKTMSGNAAITIDPSSKELDITTLTFSIGGETLKSGKGGMDKNTYAALNTKEFPNITYRLTKVVSTIKDGQNFKLNTEGDLSIAGSTKPVLLEVTAQIMPNGSLTISGTKAMTMTTFGIEPPTALMGTIKTGDEIAINFTVNYAKQ